MCKFQGNKIYSIQLFKKPKKKTKNSFAMNLFISIIIYPKSKKKTENTTANENAKYGKYWWHNANNKQLSNIDKYCSTNTNDNSRRGKINHERNTEHNWNKTVKTNKIYNKSNNLNTLLWFFHFDWQWGYGLSTKRWPFHVDLYRRLLR